MHTNCTAHLSVYRKVNSLVSNHLRCYILFSSLLFVFCFSYAATAQQFHTFHNADSINPIFNAAPKPQNISGIQFFDVDGDNDIDCYLMSDSILRLYRNVGTTKRPEYKLSDSSGLENIVLPTYFQGQHFCFFDMDGDGDKDLFINGMSYYTNHGGFYSYIKSFLNDGTPMKPHFAEGGANPLDFLNAGYLSIPFFTFQDIDGDGDLDFDYTAYTQSYQQLSDIYLNTSSNGYVSLTLLPVNGIKTSGNPRSYYDFSGDGLPDCLLNNGLYETYYRGNEGTMSAPYFDLYHVPQPGPTFGNIAATAIVDLNNDGQVEIFNSLGNYATVTPVPVLIPSTLNNGGKPITRLTASSQLPGYKYQWEYNGRKVPGYSKPFIETLKKGKYVLYITDTLGTGVSLPYIVSTSGDSTNRGIQMIAGSKPSIQTFAVKVYPNPFTQNIYINTSGANAMSPKKIRVMDMTGKILFTQTTNESSLNIGSTLAKGLYRLEVWEKNTQVFHTQILKQ